MGNNIKFRTETNGYMKEQVDRYIDTFAGAYRDLTQAYEQLREQFEAKQSESSGAASTQQVQALQQKLEEQQKQNSAAISEKDFMINNLRQENDSLQAKIRSLKEDLDKRPVENNNSDLIAKVMIDAKVFAANLQDQAKQEAEMIRLKAEKEAKSIVTAKKRAVDDLKELQSMINDVIRCAELSYIGEKGDGRHAG